ncbi:hypothetical protein [uncultured Roseobacter sp.]|uniref:hypothetical protein n=1 Tax=uncultured Roseobacter sp. TaxID=114847 RepID=UPI00261A8963|nr:hypothetical protein [uncultured Roseobacter sp.]
MFRLMLSIVLAFALTGAAAASVAHSLSGDADHAHVNGEVHDVEDRPHYTGAFSDCCDAPASKGAGHCLGDIAVALSLLSALPDVFHVGYTLGAAHYPETATLNVPTGPPKA